MTATGLPDRRTRAAGPRVEVLYESERTRVHRVWAPAAGAVEPTAADRAAVSVICKERLGRGAVERTRHESRMLERLAGVPGVVQLAASRQPDALVFDDEGGAPLADLILTGNRDVGFCVTFAVDLTRIVGAMHHAGVVHRDINPANVLVSGPGRQPLLIDFDLASTFGEDRPGFAHPREIVGTLPYLAPEQTGRTGLAVDERADLYALGATLYSLATGRAPFGVGDPLQMVHDTLATVPVPPADLDARIPRQLSDILMRLLEKEPDRRYQSADGLAHDLGRLRDDLAHSRHDRFALGERDFPLRLAAPSQLVGRDAEIATLHRAFDRAMAGRGRGLLVAGEPGVGKTALVTELRSVVTAASGWFVTGKFDQHRHDPDSNGVTQAMRALIRLVLAEPDAELARSSKRIAEGLGPNLAMVAAVVPELTTLLGLPLPPEATDGAGAALAATARMHRSGVELLSAVATRDRPVVIVIDDVQWAGNAQIDFIDAVLTDPLLSHVLLVGVYRAGEVGPTHPLATAIERWERLGTAPTVLPLANLAPTDLGELLAGMLRMTSAEAADLADAVGARTGGNPFDTIELVNALRHEGALVPGVAGWDWDAATIRRFVGAGDVVDLLAARIDQLPPSSQELVETLACLGGEVDFDLLTAASGLGVAAVHDRLVAPLEGGLLVLVDAAAPGVRFRHDRVHQAARRRLERRRRSGLQLAIARRLAATPGWASVAAEKYLESFAATSADAVADPAEQRVAAELFAGAAAAVRAPDPAAAERFLTAATALLDAAVTSADDPLPAAVERQRHAVLVSLGRLTEADEVYDRIERRGGDPVDLVEPMCVQIASLSNRGRHREAVDLGTGLLRRLGMDVPDRDFGRDLQPRSDDLARWAVTLVVAEDLARPETDDRWVLMTATLINRLEPASMFCEPVITAWLIHASQALWVEHGPCAPLVANLSAATLATVTARGDYRTGYRIGRHALAIGDARGYEPATSFARNGFATMARHWFEPLEDGVEPTQRAREGLIRGGDLMMACHTYKTSLAVLLDCSPTLDGCAADAESALEFAARTGNEHITGTFLAYRQLLRALRGETGAAGGFDDASFDETTYLEGLGGNPMAAAYFQVNRALSAALFNDSPGLIRHAAAAMPLLPFIVGFYPVALAHLLQGLALAHRVRAATPTERPALLAELNSCLDWMIARATDSRENFGHLVLLLTAERARAVGDHWGAAQAFDAARRQVAARGRPWHRGLITERAAVFHLESGLDRAGRDLLVEARRHYDAWGAAGKVAQLDEDHPFLKGPTEGRAPGVRSSVSRGTGGREGSGGRAGATTGGGLSTDEIDMLAVLRASQALSSETSIDRVRVRLGDLLKSLTGATTVLIALPDEQSAAWLVRDTAGGTAAGVPLDDAAAAGLLPLSAFRYAERTREPLLLADAVHDDRFAGDPYLAGLDRCSLLVVPILGQGVLRAVLVLENRLRRGAFSVDRLDAVMLVTGQLSVSLDNAQLYASLERKVAERTAALGEANRQLEVLSNTDALTGLANRRHFDATLEAERRRAVRQHTPLGLAMIDVDHFKAYNDTYGHIAGDTCLRLLAGALQDAVRGHPDVICRYGGEEFAAILPGADETTSLGVAERIRAAVAALRRPHPASVGSGLVTVSIGVAAYVPGRTTGAGELVAAADLALYDAKDSGRDRVRSRPHG